MPVKKTSDSSTDSLPSDVEITISKKDLKNNKTVNKWSEHVKQYSKKHNKSYGQCLKDEKCKEEYKNKQK